MDQIIIEVQEHQMPETMEVLEVGTDRVVLEVEESQLILPFQNGANREMLAIQIQPIRASRSFLWHPTHHRYSRVQRRLSEDQMIFRVCGGDGGGGVHVQGSSGYVVMGTLLLRAGEAELSRRREMFPGKIFLSLVTPPVQGVGAAANRF